MNTKYEEGIDKRFEGYERVLERTITFNRGLRYVFSQIIKVNILLEASF